MALNNQITRVGGQGIPLPVEKGQAKVGEGRESFESTLKKFVNDVNALQNEASISIDKLAKGEVTDMHDVMIAVAEANTAMEFMLEIRNKIVEAYQEIMRMPV